MATYLELNSYRKCKCVSHDDDASWHGPTSGRYYHACTCVRCAPIVRVKIRRPRVTVNPANIGMYGETIEQRLLRRRNQLWTAQNGICAMCHIPLPLDQACLDHDHSCCDTKAKNACGDCDRGVVHNNCNAILGFAHDDTKLLRQAIDYLES